VIASDDFHRATRVEFVCEIATAIFAAHRIDEEFLQIKKMWLEFRQQVTKGLSRGRSVPNDRTLAACVETETP
jgi:hypothetical protein